jgi:hypothetical protein
VTVVPDAVENVETANQHSTRVKRVHQDAESEKDSTHRTVFSVCVCAAFLDDYSQRVFKDERKTPYTKDPINVFNVALLLQHMAIYGKI